MSTNYSLFALSSLENTTEIGYQFMKRPVYLMSS